MAEREETELGDSRNWDLDNPIKSEAVKNRRTVVSVSFPSSAFQVVAAAAGEAGLSTSRFIREAAVAKASPAYVEAGVSWAGSAQSVMMNLSPSPTTLLQIVEEPLVEDTVGKAHVYMPA